LVVYNKVMDEASIESKMQNVVDIVTSDISSIRTGRATPTLVENLIISVYGDRQKLRVNELATISTTDARTIVIDPWDKSVIGEIRKGILSANVGLNPVIDGEIIRINLPMMTSEDRREYIKLLSTKIESGKIMIRQIRGEIMKNIKQAFEKKEITQDEKFNQEKRLQEITDEFVEKIEEIGKKKEQELLEI